MSDYVAVLLLAGQASAPEQATDTGWSGLALLLMFVAVVGFVLLALSIRKKPSSAGSATVRPAAPPSEPRPTAEQSAFVYERVRAHRDACLRYELGLEDLRRESPPGALDTLLEGAERVSGAPVLYFNTDDWLWEGRQLQLAVSLALEKLGLASHAEGPEPSARADSACRNWAREEARTRFDEHLSSNCAEG